MKFKNFKKNPKKMWSTDLNFKIFSLVSNMGPPYRVTKLSKETVSLEKMAIDKSASLVKNLVELFNVGK